MNISLTQRSKSHYISSQLSFTSQFLNSQYDTFISRIYGKTRQIKVQHLIPKVSTKNIEVSLPLHEGAIFKKMDDYIRNEKLSQRETRVQEMQIEKEVLKQYKEKKSAFLTPPADQSYLQVLGSCENYKPKFRFVRFNSPIEPSTTLTKVNELLSQRKTRHDIYKKQLEHERKWSKNTLSRNLSEKTTRISTPLRLRSIDQIIKQCREQSQGCSIEIKEINKNKGQIYKNYQTIKDQYNDVFNS